MQPLFKYFFERLRKLKVKFLKLNKHSMFQQSGCCNFTSRDVWVYKKFKVLKFLVFSVFRIHFLIESSIYQSSYFPCPSSWYRPPASLFPLPQSGWLAAMDMRITRGPVLLLVLLPAASGFRRTRTHSRKFKSTLPGLGSFPCWNTAQIKAIWTQSIRFGMAIGLCLLYFAALKSLQIW